jgi:predicted nucleic acid-binding protein
LVDPNVASELVRPHPEPRVETWIAAQELDTLFISAVSFGEPVKEQPCSRRESGKRKLNLGLNP